MRELKLRAWLKKQKCYAKVLGIGFYEGEVRVQYQQGELVVHNISIPFEDVILEQYTELKDKNDKEIYEGDIVDYDDDGKCIGVVKYDAPHYELIDKDGYAMFLKGAPHQAIIGNIRENPELCGEEE